MRPIVAELRAAANHPNGQRTARVSLRPEAYGVRGSSFSGGHMKRLAVLTICLGLTFPLGPSGR